MPPPSTAALLLTPEMVQLLECWLALSRSEKGVGDRLQRLECQACLHKHPRPQLYVFQGILRGESKGRQGDYVTGE